MKTKRIQTHRSFWALALLLGALTAATAAEETKKDSSKAQAIQPAAGALSLADFETGKPDTLAGTLWEVFTDAILGGKSTFQLAVAPEGAQGSHRALRMTGKLTADVQSGGFAGTRALLQPGGGP